MKFCTSCNQERTGDNRFCTTCGAELTNTASDYSDTDTFTIKRARPDEPPADRAYQETQRVVPATPSAQSSTPSSADRAYQETRLAGWDQPAGWGQSATLPPPGDPHSQQGQHPGYPGPDQYSQPGRYPQPAGYSGGTYPPSPAPGPRRSGHGRTMALAAGAVVVVLAAGGGAFAVVSSLHHGKGGTPDAQSSSPGLSTSPTAAATTAPATPTPKSASPTPASTPTGPVAFAAGVSGNPYAAPVETTFTHYFGGINAHDYAEYASSLDAAMQKANSQSSFDSGYSTTTDSGETINSIAGSGSNLTAVVTFKSMQAASDSPDGSTCNNYTLTLPLVRQGSGYVVATPPSGYASYTDC
jgi:hypothetical protein